jgi:hypothetical protein
MSSFATPPTDSAKKLKASDAKKQHQTNFDNLVFEKTGIDPSILSAKAFEDYSKLRKQGLEADASYQAAKVTAERTKSESDIAKQSALAETLNKILFDVYSHVLGKEFVEDVASEAGSTVSGDAAASEKKAIDLSKQPIDQIAGTRDITTLDRYDLADDLVSSLTDMEVDSAFMEFEYEGFDANKILATLVKKGTARKDFKSDVKTLVLAGTARGTNINKMLISKNMKPEGIAKLTVLKDSYDIAINAKLAGKEGITIGRILTLFPSLQYEARKRLKSAGKLPIIGTVPAGLDTVLCFPSAAALFPADTTYNAEFDLWMTWSYSFSQVINPKLKDEALTLVKNSALNFGNIQRRSVSVRDDVKKKIMFETFSK